MSLTTLRRMSPREVLVAAQLVAAAGILEAALRLVRFPRLAGWVRRRAAASAVLFPFGSRSLRPPRKLRLADGAARFWRGADCCLPRALLTLWLMLGERHEARLVIGVRRVAGEPFRAHAWVEADGCVFGERQDAVSGFTILAWY